MATGTLDARGVYHYGEDDAEADFSSLLNLGMEAISEALAYFAGPPAKRQALYPAPPGSRWKDTTGSRALWSPAPDGTWRRHQGTHTAPAAAWSDNFQGGIHLRTITAVIPTVLAADETMMVTLANDAGTFAMVSLDRVERGPASTTLTLRYMQVMNSSPSGCRIAWQIVEL
ncbi:hypothetical protein [Leucobacter chironomi]|uniref:hypothetical protein n=1 Tax=Leucobacter chironomi TaxID=491918 RepID=UPI000418921E|nr:hypothetical protein [Leucobacter chironomi]